MISLWFSDADLRKITLAPTPNALWETVLSVRRLRTGSVGGRRSRPGTERRIDATLAPGMLLDLLPPGRFLPDFLLQPAADDFATGVEMAVQTPAAQLADDLSRLPSASRASRLVRELAAGTGAAREILANDLRVRHRSNLEPVWSEVRANAVADRSLRAETLLRGGVDAFLTTLNPLWVWQPPVLRVPSQSTADIPLCGRGLLLIPSFFAPGPTVMYRPDQSTVLTYRMYSGERPGGSADALGPLLGRTRAAVLAGLRDPATTTAVAERVGISLASASQHATVLRNAGLVSTARLGGAVLHTLTPLGEALLAGDSAAG
ncbi:winged helix-turn-helix domain-containing protein [Planotetraspora sp. A-T 1434]|uniref:ArsR/SmtB family transcription factor n=1 Tax=Planotetraspora sp. A-T 1434 TaxID=2979219 RepID=UPI0021C0C999|nr:winged helix-turn-helix domain-containing protein [Planotetraspora sp. A-T 1434]MCT9934122.1 winged helix-turn-helix domain-containing protein [Planotetraspora sp. A-T 1434]